MPCYSPLTGYYSAERTGTAGKGPLHGPFPSRRLVFDKRKANTGVSLKIPCGQCIGCKIDRSYQWAVRCLHEAKLHKNNCFVTLTYEDKKLPENGSLDPRAMQLFMKRLRKKKVVSDDTRIRFFLCGEYGDVTLRPHYHALLFNCSFPDRKAITHSRSKRPQYVSAELAKIWEDGIHTIGDVTYESAAYTARYCLKKLTGEMVAEYGGRTPEFARMSRNPGLATDYYDRYGDEIRYHDSIIINGRERPPPRLYDRKFEILNTDAFKRMKKKRLRKAAIFRSDNTTARRRVKEVVAIAKLRRKEGTL